MQPIRRLTQTLDQLACAKNRLFSPNDLRTILPTLTDGVFKALLHRAVKGVI